MSVKGGVCDHEAYESKKIKIFFLLCEHIAPTSFLYIYILLKISILLTGRFPSVLVNGRFPAN